MVFFFFKPRIHIQTLLMCYRKNRKSWNLIYKRLFWHVSIPYFRNVTAAELLTSGCKCKISCIYISFIFPSVWFADTVLGHTQVVGDRRTSRKVYARHRILFSFEIIKVAKLDFSELGIKTCPCFWRDGYVFSHAQTQKWHTKKAKTLSKSEYSSPCKYTVWVSKWLPPYSYPLWLIVSVWFPMHITASVSYSVLM